ncbi:class I SAM-dependent methyltransferase [Nocardioides caldifontis]|uniref:class I SAM-dependent methyltransferase n=1 Tax=Nocardioides caldifontis TaxID=2588938 RepID=UPI0011DFC33C|nr:class I SAM-dependent methyltransferase [Nocardioides caldifontis]
MNPSPPDPARAFGSVAEAYDRGRPTYPLEAAEWMVGRQPSTVVELGAGTGKFTDLLVRLGHDVLATDPDDEMLSHLRLRHPDVRTATAPAEAVPVATRSVDTVVAAQAFHWFDSDAALREAARMLKPEGRIALVWNEPDTRIPWVRKLAALIGRQEVDADPTDILVASKRFGFVEETTFRHWQPLRRQQLLDLVRSRSNVATMDPMAQERLLRKVDELFDAYDRGPDGLLLPYVTRCYRAVVRPRGTIEEPEHSADLTAAAEAVRAGSRQEGDGDRGDQPQAAPEDPGTTLIDFR